MSTRIEKVKTRKILNSRGDETIEVDIKTKSGFGRAAAPSGASKGSAEAIYYPNGNVDAAIKTFKESIAPKLVGLNASQQKEIDLLLKEIDGTENFSGIGGNTAFAVSLCAAKAAADSHKMLLYEYLGRNLAYELPFPLGNVLSGGRHAHGRAPDIQEFLVLPVQAKSFWEAAKANVTFHRKLGEALRKTKKTFTSGKSDEGAWIVNSNNVEAFETVAETCEEVSEKVGFNCRLGVDIAASTLWNARRKSYSYTREETERTSEEQMQYVSELIERYNLAYVEDPFHEEDFESFSLLTKTVGKCLVCGDDLFATNVKRLEHGIKMAAANSTIIKPNQIGTLTDALEAAKMARNALYTPVMSHRSGETANGEIAHLAIAFQCPIVKMGVVEGARIAKIDELIRIEDSLEKRARMADIQL